MKKLFSLALCVLGFILIAAPTAVEYYPVYINGNFIGNGVVIPKGDIITGVVIQGGIFAIPLADFAKAIGAPLTLEPTLLLQGNRLFVREAARTAGKHNEGNLVPAVNKADQVMKIKTAPGQFLKVQHAGQISPRDPKSPGVVMVNGRAYVPVDDVRSAMGDGSVRSFFDRKPGQAIQLNITPNERAIIAILVGL